MQCLKVVEVQGYTTMSFSMLSLQIIKYELYVTFM